jgi:hypothetical protein
MKKQFNEYQVNMDKKFDKTQKLTEPREDFYELQN